MAGRLHGDLGVHQAGGANDLLHLPAPGLLQLIGTRGGGDIDQLVHPGLELFETEGPVVQGRRQAKAVIDQGLFAGAVSPVHPLELGDGDVGFVDDHQGFPGQVVEQGRGRLPLGAAGEVAGIILDAVAKPQLLHHFQVETGALSQALGLQQFPLLLEPGEALAQLRLDGGRGLAAHQVGGDVMGGRVDRDFFEAAQGLAPQGVDLLDALHRVAPEFDADGQGLFVGRKDLHPVAPHPKSPPVKIDVISLVEDLHQLGQDLPAVHGRALFQVEEHAVVGLR